MFACMYMPLCYAVFKESLKLKPEGLLCDFKTYWAEWTAIFYEVRLFSGILLRILYFIS